MRKCPLLVLVAVLSVLGMAVTLSAETINIGISGTASQESTMTSGGVSYIAAWSNNGDYGEKGAATNYGSAHLNPWWEVDMTLPITVDDVWVFYRTSARVAQRAYNLSLQVLDAPGGNVLYDSATLTPPEIFNPYDGVTFTTPLLYCGLEPAKFDVPSNVTGEQVFRINKASYRNLPGTYDEVIDTWEIEVRADDGLTGPNVAEGAPVTILGDGGSYYTSTNYYILPSNVTDDSIGTYCSSDTDVDVADTFGYQIDLGQSYSDLTHIKIYPRQEAAMVGGGSWAKRLGDYIVSLHDDVGGAPAATPNWTYTRNGNFSGALGDADVITAGMGTGTFAGQWIQVEATDTHLLNNEYGTHPSGYCCLQISEVRAFIPEPSTLVLLIGGLLAMLVRRR